MEKQEVIIEKEIKDQEAYDIEIQRMAQIIQDHIRLENHRTSVFIIYLIMVAVLTSSFLGAIIFLLVAGVAGDSESSALSIVAAVYFILLFVLDVFAYRRL